MKLHHLFTSILFFIILQTRSQVIVVSTIHGAHKENKQYSYEDLFQVINDYDPDVIGVEIRKTDINAPLTYLSDNYPFEMYTILQKYKDKKIEGFDWLGEELEGKQIPTGYWKKHPLKMMDEELHQDTTLSKKMKVAHELQELKLSFFPSSSHDEFQDGRYDAINKAYYLEMEKVLQGTKYEILMAFYRRRNEKIVDNIKTIIRNHPGKRILFVTGADHRSFVMEGLACGNAPN